MNDAYLPRDTVDEPSDASLRLAFFRKLQALSTRIHATGSLDELMLDLGTEFCALLHCERFTLYAMDHEKDYLISKVKTGLATFRDLKLAVSPHSIAGHVALTRATLNIADVYDEAELRRISADLRFQTGVDQRTGYRTREMLAAPLVSAESHELLGVVQFINNRDGGPFSSIALEGVQELCATLAVAFSQRLKAPQQTRAAYASQAAEDEDGDSAELPEAAEDELAELLQKMIADAGRQGVTDIHIEPLSGQEQTGIRFRKDGSLLPYGTVPAAWRAALVARLKSMSGLDVAERRLPQEGKLRFRQDGAPAIELRVTTIPSSGGVEDVVLHLLAAGAPRPLDQLGMLPFNLDRLRAAVDQPSGLFLVCGPSGAGKTTTLHAILHYLNRPESKIWTAEDPVEITQKGLRQVPVHRQAGPDFATAMRAFLRADPDIIMLGEMGEPDSASLGLEAALSGHLVLATLPTRSAPESALRLLAMGQDAFHCADALLGVLAQRLAKRLCGHCKLAYHPGAAELELLLTEFCGELQHTPGFQRDAKASRANVLAGWRERHAGADGRFTLYRAVGCAQCHQGYQGRVGLHELMLGTPRLKARLQEQARAPELLAAALEDGMLTLKMDGIEKVLLGLTDIRMVRAACSK